MKKKTASQAKRTYAVMAGVGFAGLFTAAYLFASHQSANSVEGTLAKNYGAEPGRFTRIFRLSNPDLKGVPVTPDDLRFIESSLDDPNEGIRKHAVLALLTRRDSLGPGHAQKLVEDRFFLPQFVPNRDIMLLVLFRLSPESEAKWTTWANQHPEWRPMVEVHHQWKAARKPSHL
jgi:hypothetical protein